MTIRIEIDHDACVGYGECIAEDAEAVELDADGCAKVKVAELDEQRAKRLCDACPTGAIRMAG